MQTLVQAYLPPDDVDYTTGNTEWINHKLALPNTILLDYPFLDDSIVLCEQVTTIDVSKQIVQYVGMIRQEDKEKLYDTFLKNFIL